MAVTTFIYRPRLATIATLTLDAAVREMHLAELEVTDHPVESGVDITDHARERPEELTIEGIISDTPLNAAQAARANAKAGPSLQPPTVAPLGRPGLAQAAYEELRRIKARRELITVTTKLHTYQNMMLVSLEVPRDGQSGDALRFTVRLRQVRVVSAQTASVSLEPRGANQSKAGQKAKQTVAAPADDAFRSILKRSTDAFGATAPGSGL